VVLSYHGFNGSKAAERVRFSLLLLEKAAVRISFVADFLDKEKMEAPANLLEETLQDLGYYCAFEGLTDELIKNSQALVVNSDKIVRVSPFYLKSEVGRARNLPKSDIKWCSMKGCEAFEGYRIIMLDASGDMWPCQTVLRDPRLSIGNFGEMSLKRALKRSKRAISSRRQQHFNSQKSCQLPCFHCLP